MANNLVEFKLELDTKEAKEDVDYLNKEVTKLLNLLREAKQLTNELAVQS